MAGQCLGQGIEGSPSVLEPSNPTACGSVAATSLKRSGHVRVMNSSERIPSNVVEQVLCAPEPTEEDVPKT